MKAINILVSITRLSFIKSEIDRLIGYAILFSLSLVIFRIWYTRELTFMFMPWNLFLAYLPYQLLKIYTPSVKDLKSRMVFSAVFVAWLLLIPNAFYMITDLFHLFQRENIPLWFDLVLLMSFAWNGMILGFLSVRQMEKNLLTIMPAMQEGLFAGGIMFLNSFGVYLGRYLRFNSWDIISNPFSLAKDIVLLIIHPMENRAAWAMIMAFTIMMMIIYKMLKKLSRQLL
ncbi:MAG: DUF1361 domain-containing protein [Chitinophagaceae bacterium]|nr:MAG: DUF1361 domain-containing protein [Chitinophagaceae bacterium]